MKQPKGAEAIKFVNKRLYLLIAIAAAVAALLVFGLLFGRAYRKLELSIQQERADYVSEISNQIITSQQFMKEEYANTAADYAGILNSYADMSMPDLRRHISSRADHEILLINAAGDITDLSGAPVYISDRSLLTSLFKNDGVSQVFGSLNDKDDYWLFAAPLNSVLIDGMAYRSLVLAVSADEFRSSLAVSLFDNRGASYIIQRNGSISIRPRESGMTMGGYNLFVSLVRAGADLQEVAMLETEMSESSSGNHILTIDKSQWLISYSALDEGDEMIVVTVPLTVTAAQTYAGLNDTIVCATLLVLAISIIALSVILYFFRRDRQRSREAMMVAAKSDFLTKMSHDIRTPLNAIIGMELLAKDSADDPEAVSEYLAKSTAAANYLLNLINDVLDMSRIESGKMSINSEPFDMDTLIADIYDVITPSIAEKGLRLDVDAAGFNTAYLGDQVRIKQILMNLMNNAEKFTQPGGSVSLSVSCRDAGEGRDIVTLVISDTGIGMSEDYIPHIFKPFEQERSSYTQQYAGSGLGLSIVHNLVMLMGGTIEVDSKLGAGSRFTVELPLTRCEKIRSVEKDAASQETSFVGKRILLAEDNTVNQQVAVALLVKKFGILTDVAEDGKRAVEMFAASPEGTYSMILMDVKMPVMDGLEATKQIRALPRPDAASIPIVALSANAYAEDVRLSLLAGMNAHLPKPIGVKPLTEVLHKCIHEKEEDEP